MGTHVTALLSIKRTRSRSGWRRLVVGLRYNLVETRHRQISQAEFSDMTPRDGIERTMASGCALRDWGYSRRLPNGSRAENY